MRPILFGCRFFHALRCGESDQSHKPKLAMMMASVANKVASTPVFVLLCQSDAYRLAHKIIFKWPMRNHCAAHFSKFIDGLHCVTWFQLPKENCIDRLWLNMTNWPYFSCNEASENLSRCSLYFHHAIERNFLFQWQFSSFNNNSLMADWFKMKLYNSVFCARIMSASVTRRTVYNTHVHGRYKIFIDGDSRSDHGFDHHSFHLIECCKPPFNRREGDSVCATSLFAPHPFAKIHSSVDQILFSVAPSSGNTNTFSLL